MQSTKCLTSYLGVLGADSFLLSSGIQIVGIRRCSRRVGTIMSIPRHHKYHTPAHAQKQSRRTPGQMATGGCRWHTRKQRGEMAARDTWQ